MDSPTVDLARIANHMAHTLKSLACEKPVVWGPNKGLPATGLSTGYDRHRNAGETPCEPCRLANNARASEWYDENREKGQGIAKKWRDNNPGRVRESEAKYWAKNHDKKLAKGARYREKNRKELSLKAVKYVHQRRARKLNAPVGIAYEREDIFQRDNWECQICFEPIDRQLPWPDPKSKSIDHIIELYNGGPDCETNVRASHLTCNLSRKRAHHG